MRALKSASKAKILSYLLALIPVFILVHYLYMHALNVPFWDQWELVPILQHVNNGHFYFHDFWQQHNEHRLFFPRFIMVAAALVTNWNLKAEVFISVCLAIISFVFLLVILRRSHRSNEEKLPFLLPITLSGVWFSLLQYENWLWGWQIQWYLNVLAITLVMYALSRLNKASKSQIDVVLATAGAFIAQYSLGNGVLIWPILIASLIYLRIRFPNIIGVGLVGVVSTVLYYTNYHDPAGGPSKGLAVHHPIEYVKYVSAYLGRPLTYHYKLAAVLGLSLALSFVAFSVYLFWKKPDRFKNTLPFIALGLYAVASALITGLSRLGFGLGQSMTSRYTTISSLLLVSIIAIVVINRDLFASVLKKSYFFVAWILAALLIFAVISNMNWARQKADVQGQYLKDIKQCTSQVDPYQVCLLSTYPNEKIVTPRLNYLKGINWGGY